MKTNFKLFTILMALVTMLFVESCKKDKTEAPSTALNAYYTYWNSNTVNKIDLVNSPNASTNLFDETDGISTPATLTITDDGFLIVCLENADQIVKMHKNGSGDVVVLYDNADGVNSPTAVTIDNATGTIYWCNSGSGQVMKGSADGLSAVTPLFGGQAVISYAYGIGIDKKHNKLFTSDFDEYIKVGKLDGSGTTTVLYDTSNFDQMGAPSNLFVDAGHGKLYWADENASNIVAANIDGTGTPEVLFDQSDGVNRADGVFVDYTAKKIYWTETNANVIARGNLDGSGMREVLISGVESYGLVLDFK